VDAGRSYPVLEYLLRRKTRKRPGWRRVEAERHGVEEDEKY
jgi:hypothetical protein